MGKDKSGTFHPGKGKPSGLNKEEGLGIQATDLEKMDEYLEMTAKYTAGEDEPAPTVSMRHPNRSASKGEDTYKGKENTANIHKTGKADLDVDHDKNDFEFTEIQLPLSRETILDLRAVQSDLCVSIYLGTNQAGLAVNEGKDIIGFKNRIQELSAELSKNMDQASIDDLLGPAYNLIKSEDFWHQQSQGLALFISPGFHRLLRMPVPVNDQMIVSNKFSIAPLIGLLPDTENFYVLVLSKHKLKLFYGSRMGMQFVPVEDLPDSLEDVKRLSDKDASTWRTGSRGGTGGANFHGIGGGNPDDKTNIATYFEFVDDILFKQIFNKENVPLVLAGVEYLIPIYKSVCDYHNVYPDGLTGSYEHVPTSELHSASLKVLAPYLDEKKNKTLNKFGNKSATELTSSIVTDVVVASATGRVAQLMVKKESRVNGTYNPENLAVNLTDMDSAGAIDLVEFAIENTIANSGEVRILDAGEMPVDAPVAAIFRY